MTQRKWMCALICVCLIIVPIACDIPVQSNAPVDHSSYVVIATHTDGSILHRSHSMIDPVPVGLRIMPVAHDPWLVGYYAWSYQRDSAEWNVFAIQPGMDIGTTATVNWWNTEDLTLVPPGTTIFLRAVLYTESLEKFTSPVVEVMVIDPVWSPNDESWYELPQCACSPPDPTGCGMIALSPVPYGDSFVARSIGGRSTRR